jgi:predicted lipoprotein with Yx(FWY)xxD motif
MMKRPILAMVAVLALLVAAAAVTQAQASPTVQTKQDKTLGTILADAKGLTLYAFTKDTTPGQSSCTDQCAANWPPLTATDAPTLAPGLQGTLGTISRPDGTTQVTYNGMPLYTYAKDEDAEDAYGQGIGGAWFVVAPGSSIANLVGAPAATPAAGTTVTVRYDPTLGYFLADAQGKALYLYLKDTTKGESACTDQCAANWPPLSASGELSLPAGVPGTLGTITRADGSTQVTYNDIPLYTFAKDEDAEDVYGQGVGGVWFVANPGAQFGAVTAPAAATPATPAGSIYGNY